MNKLLEDKVDKVLLSSLSVQSIEALKQKLHNEVEVGDIDKHVDILRGIDAYGNEVLRKELKEIHQKHFGNSNKLVFGMRIKWLIILAILALTGLLFYLSHSSSIKSSDHLYAE